MPTGSTGSGQFNGQTDRGTIHGIIHTTSIAAGGVAAGLAQVPGADIPAIMAIQIPMVIGIAQKHGIEMSKSGAAALISSIAARTFGLTISRQLVGWIPGFGNAIKATTAIAITEALGWAADAYFRSGKR